jgi:biopolymer transport protein TolR
MAMGSLGNGNGRGIGAGARRGYRPMSEINVTPMVDVMLVLLVVFMVTAPLLTAGVPVDLPKTQAAQLTGQDEPLVVSIDKTGGVFLQDHAIELAQLGPRLAAITQSRKDARIFVRGDKSIAYGRIMEVMGAVNHAGFAKVSLVAEIPAEAAKPGRGRR